MTGWQVTSLIGGGTAVLGLGVAIVALWKLVGAIRESKTLDGRHRSAVQRAEELAGQLDEVSKSKRETEQRLRREIADLRADISRCVVDYDKLDDDQLLAELERMTGGAQ